MTDMQIIVDGLLTQYELTGQGKLMLLLHGWGDDLRGLRALQLHFSKKYKVLAIDLPGFGGTQPPASVWDLEAYAQFLKQALHKLALSQPDVIIGHSNGGAIAIKAVADDILKPKQLVLLAASGIRSPNSAKRLTFKVMAKSGNLATIWMPEQYRRALRQSLYSAAGSDMLLKPSLQGTFKKTVSEDLLADAARIRIPTLLIFAENDQAVPKDSGQKYEAAMKHATLKMLPHTGHFVHLEQPEKVTQLIEEFL